MIGGRFVLVCALAALGCESGDDVPASTFDEADQARSREIWGYVWRGQLRVEGAVVRVFPSPGIGVDTTSNEATIVTDAFGSYRLERAPLFYDLSIRSGRDVVVYRDVANRLVDPSLGESAPPPAWTAKVLVSIEPPPSAGHALAFFASGDDVVGLSGDAERGLTLSISRFSAPSQGARPPAIHVVEHESGQPLGAATAYGTADVGRAIAGRPVAVTVRMSPVSPREVTRVSVVAPPGTQAVATEILVYFGVRALARSVGTADEQGRITVTRIPNAAFVLRARATRGGAVSETPFAPYDPSAREASLSLVDYPALEGFDGTALSARATDVREHVLAPLASGGTTVRFLSRMHTVTVADLARLGAAPPSGRYAWTVRHWPGLRDVTNMGGPDVRDTRPSAVTEQRTIEIP